MNAHRILAFLNRFLVIISSAILISGAFLTIFAFTAEAQTPKLSVCHWTEAGKWESILPSENSVASAADWYNGHGGHENDAWPAFIATNGDPIPAQKEDIFTAGCNCPAGTVQGVDDKGKYLPNCVVPPVFCNDVKAANFGLEGQCIYSVCILPGYTTRSNLTLEDANSLIGTTDSFLLYPSSPACLAPTVAGCTDASASNFNTNATIEDDSCLYASGSFVLDLVLGTPYCNTDHSVQWTVENPNTFDVNVISWTLDDGSVQAGFSASPGENLLTTTSQGTHSIDLIFGDSQMTSLTSTTNCTNPIIPVTAGPLMIPVTGSNEILIPVTGEDQFSPLAQWFIFGGISILGFAIMLSIFRKKNAL